VSTVLNPVWGAFSDRTVLRIGRRLPWVLGGLVVGVVAMVVLSQATTVLAMCVGWCLAQGGLNAMLAAITATVPDQVPVLQRGAVGGWLAIAQTLGVVLGSGIAMATGSIAAGYLTTAGLLVVLSLPYCLDSRDVALAPEDRPPFDALRFVRSFWVSPREHPDFAWAWITRFLMNLANALLLLYLLYYLQDAVDLSRKAAEAGVFRLTLLYAVLTVVTAILGGIWSDRLARRKVFVTASGYVIAAALLLLAFVHSYPGAYVGAAILGVGFGIYTAVDFALITQVLPTDADRAKDLGVINIANALPQVLAPVSPPSCSASAPATRPCTSSLPSRRCWAASWCVGSWASRRGDLQVHPARPGVPFVLRAGLGTRAHPRHLVERAAGSARRICSSWARAAICWA
jgi:MFS family permease